MVSHRRRRTFVANGSAVSRGDRNRNARLARMRGLAPVANPIVGIDLAGAEQMVVVTDHAAAFKAVREAPTRRTLGVGARRYDLTCSRRRE